jgi:hypothetical protein
MTESAWLRLMLASALAAGGSEWDCEAVVFADGGKRLEATVRAMVGEAAWAAALASPAERGALLREALETYADCVGRRRPSRRLVVFRVPVI